MGKDKGSTNASQSSGKKRKQEIVDHPEDAVFSGSHEDIGAAAAALEETHKSLSGMSHSAKFSSDISGFKHTPRTKERYENEIAKATELYGSMSPESLDYVSKSSATIKRHADAMALAGIDPTVSSYASHLNAKKGAETEGKKGKFLQKKTELYDGEVDSVKSNTPDLQNVFKLHGHMKKAKNALLAAIGKDSVPKKLTVEIGGKTHKLEKREL